MFSPNARLLVLFINGIAVSFKLFSSFTHPGGCVIDVVRVIEIVGNVKLVQHGVNVS